MALQDALTFLREARRDEALRQHVEELDEHAPLTALSEIAGRAGLHFTSEELRRAHALDWNMRWQRYASAR
jgi:hypothetical protein